MQALTLVLLILLGSSLNEAYCNEKSIEIHARTHEGVASWLIRSSLARQLCIELNMTCRLCDTTSVHGYNYSEVVNAGGCDVDRSDCTVFELNDKVSTIADILNKTQCENTAYLCTRWHQYGLRGDNLSSVTRILREDCKPSNMTVVDAIIHHRRGDMAKSKGPYCDDEAVKSLLTGINGSVVLITEGRDLYNLTSDRFEFVNKSSVCELIRSMPKSQVFIETGGSFGNLLRIMAGAHDEYKLVKSSNISRLTDDVNNAIRKEGVRLNRKGGFGIHRIAGHSVAE